MPNLTETMPYGAGLVVRREVAHYYYNLHQSERRNIQLDRTASSLFSAGDNDLAACACDIGLGVGIFDSLRLDHFIPKERISEKYLTDLAEVSLIPLNLAGVKPCFSSLTILTLSNFR